MAATRIAAALELIAELPDTTDVSDVLARAREVIGRFGFETLMLDGVAASADAVPGYVLLVGWNREGLHRRLSGGGETASAPPRRAPADFARLGPRWRGSAAAPAPIDHWAIVPVGPNDPGPTSEELEVLRRLADLVNQRLEALEASKRRAGRRPLLSRRERECLQWTAAGKTTWEIAGILEISQNTVDGYISTAGRKLGAVNRTQAVAEALRRGLID